MRKLVTAAAFVLALASPVRAQESVIGLIMPLTGTGYAAVWPEKSAAARLIYPFKGGQ